tara:strand:- start:1367 stop:2353 length:987 start_codon:yes stop_codon:yes gene_type:complete
MKAVIFSCSLKDGKNSSSQSWSELLASKMQEQSIDTKIINLKQFDYEASTGQDLLHEQLAECYDANFITFAAPINFKNVSFFARNLAERFAYANKKASADGIDLFAGKQFEVCIMHGCKNDHLPDGKEIYVEYDGKYTKKFKSFLPELDYILPNRFLNLRVWQPADKHGPDRKKLHLDTDTVNDVDDTIQAFKKNYKEFKSKVLIRDWLSYFKCDEPNAFGRGYTLSPTAINTDSVQKHIDWTHKNINDVNIKAQIFVSMKERCIRSDCYDQAELYFNEQFELGEEGKLQPGDTYDTKHNDPNKIVVVRWKKNGFRITRSANYRPNNY